MSINWHHKKFHSSGVSVPRVCKQILFVSLNTLVIIALPLTVFGQNWDPPAIRWFPNHDDAVKKPEKLLEMIGQGKSLFEARFNLADGAGRPAATGGSGPTVRRRSNDLGFSRVSGPDANSCAGCHNQPIIGGSGDFAVNVFVGANNTDPPTTSIAPDVTAERNTISLAGSYAIELLAREISTELQSQRDIGIRIAKASGRDVVVPLLSKGVEFGECTLHPDGSVDTTRVEGIDQDLVVKPFGSKGVVVSLREFTINALNQHHGIQAVERFGRAQTGWRDFDQDGVESEFTIGQVTAMVLFQASIPAPSRVVGENELHGERLFRQVGCASCHIPEMRLKSRVFAEPGTFNRPGTLSAGHEVKPVQFPLPIGNERRSVSLAEDGEIVVRAFTDFKRHVISDETDSFLGNEQQPQNGVAPSKFITSKLWDVATSAPYGHRGDCTTVSEVILHHAGEAKDSRDAFLSLPDNDKRSLVMFLLSLGAPADESVK